MAETHGIRNGTGIVCASSKMTTLFAMLCSFLHFDVFAAYSDSKNCTAVVTTTGASQFSQASRLR